MSIYSSPFMTSYGAGIVYANDQGIVKVEIPDLSSHESTCLGMPPEFNSSALTDLVANMLKKYFQGENVDFSDTPLVLDGMTPFRLKVLYTIMNLRYGNICSYGQLATESGYPLAARAVGGALASNPVPVIIPCHRVVASDGCLTGFSAPGGAVTKMALLKMEGIEFNELLVVTKQLVMNSNSDR